MNAAPTPRSGQEKKVPPKKTRPKIVKKMERVLRNDGPFDAIADEHIEGWTKPLEELEGKAAPKAAEVKQPPVLKVEEKPVSTQEGIQRFQKIITDGISEVERLRAEPNGDEVHAEKIDKLMAVMNKAKDGLDVLRPIQQQEKIESEVLPAMAQELEEEVEIQNRKEQRSRFAKPNRYIDQGKSTTNSVYPPEDYSANGLGHKKKNIWKSFVDSIKSLFKK